MESADSLVIVPNALKEVVGVCCSATCAITTNDLSYQIKIVVLLWKDVICSSLLPFRFTFRPFAMVQSCSRLNTINSVLLSFVSSVVLPSYKYRLCSRPGAHHPSTGG